MVQRLARGPFKAEIRVRFPLALPPVNNHISLRRFFGRPFSSTGNPAPSRYTAPITKSWLKRHRVLSHSVAQAFLPVPQAATQHQSQSLAQTPSRSFAFSSTGNPACAPSRYTAPITKSWLKRHRVLSHSVAQAFLPVPQAATQHQSQILGSNAITFFRIQ